MAANGAPPAKALTHRETILIVLGVLLPVFMGSLDGTILASALPSIGRELGEVHNLPWLITAYLIANTSVTTLYGKISDIHGRRTTLIISIQAYGLDESLEEAAGDMGATRWQILRKIPIPLRLPGMISATCFAVRLSWGNFAVSLGTTGADRALPEGL